MSEIGLLKDHERLYLWRRRKRYTQARAARHFRVVEKVYGAMERGEQYIPLKLDLKFFLGRLAAYERCLIYRRRAGKTQAQIAADLEVSRGWVNYMESGERSCDLLVWYWEQ